MRRRKNQWLIEVSATPGVRRVVRASCERYIREKARPHRLTGKRLKQLTKACVRKTLKTRRRRAR